MKTNEFKKQHNNNILGPGLYIVGMPIGNNLDLTFRAFQVLRDCDLILAEDTRTTKKLLLELGIENKKLLSHHNHNESATSFDIIQKIKKEKISVALVSDAGTPAINDPGVRLVREAHAAGIPVIPIPGPSSLTAALSVSGISGGQILFGGFLPSNKKDRFKLLKKNSTQANSLVFFEAPHRLTETLEDIKQIFGPNQEICICREMTKTYETVWLAKAEEVLSHYLKNPPKGECVLVIKSSHEAAFSEEELKIQIEKLLSASLSHKEILNELLPVSELPKKALYKLITKLKKV